MTDHTKDQLCARIDELAKENDALAAELEVTHENRNS